MDDLCTLRGLDQLGKMYFCKDMTMQLRKKKKPQEVNQYEIEIHKNFMW